MKKNMLTALLQTPLHRRRQTLAVATWFYCPVLSIALFALLLYYYKYTWPVLIAYCTWLFYSFRAPFEGKTFGWLSGLVEKSRVFLHFSAYFPATVEFYGGAEEKFRQCADDGQYMFGYHPHGIFGLGAVAAFVMNKPAALSGLKLRLLTVDFNFYIPIWRELLMSLGLAGVGRESVRRLLATRHSLAIVIGGAREALDATPGSCDLVLRKRKGFFREALSRGCAVVPVFGFGENDLYDQMCRPESWLRSCQDRLIHIFGFTLPLFNGRGMFNYERGVLPRRHALHVVVGEPITVERVECPSAEQIEALQAVYIEQLTALYDAFKEKYHKNRTRSLRVIM
jgi:2-acylglycerol O-acyltransferase 2